MQGHRVLWIWRRDVPPWRRRIPPWWQRHRTCKVPAHPSIVFGWVLGAKLQSRQLRGPPKPTYAALPCRRGAAQIKSGPISGPNPMG